LEGSLALFIFGFLGAASGLIVLNLSPTISLSMASILFKAIIGSAVGSVTEALTLGPLEPFDNFTVPIISAMAVYLL